MGRDSLGVIDGLGCGGLGQRNGFEHVGVGFQDAGFFLLLGPDDLFIGFGDLEFLGADRRVDILQADKDNFGPQFGRVGRSLNVGLEIAGGLLTAMGHDGFNVHAGHVADHFAIGQTLEQQLGLAVAIRPRADVLDQELDRDAYGQQVDRNDLLRFRRVGRDILLTRRHQQVELLFVVGAGPEDGAFSLEFLIGHETDIEALDLRHRVPLDLIDGTGKLEGDSGLEDGSGGLTEAFAQTLLSGVDEHNAVAGSQDADPDEGEAAELFFQKAVEPTVADPETKLVVEGLSRRGEQSGRLTEQADQSAFVDEADFLALNPRPIGFEDQRQQGFDAHQGQQCGQHPSDLAVILRESEPLEAFAGGRQKGQQGTEHESRPPAAADGFPPTGPIGRRICPAGRPPSSGLRTSPWPRSTVPRPLNPCL